MSYRIEYQIRAINEYEDAADWYFERSEQASENFSIAVEEKINILRKEPKKFRKKFKEFREVRLNRYPYKIIYTVNEKERIVSIASVFHQKRDPETKFRNLK